MTDEEIGYLNYLEDKNAKLKECLEFVRSQLYDKNNEETILTNAIDIVLNDKL